MQKRRLNVSFNKSGSGSVSTSMRLPITWIKRMEVTPEDREVDVSFIGKKITMKKAEVREMDLNLSQVASQMHDFLINNDRGIEAAVIIEENGNIRMTSINNGEKYLKNNRDSEFICVLTMDDCKRGTGYVVDYIEDKFYEVTNSVEYKIKHQLRDILLSGWGAEGNEIDITNGYLYLDGHKLCRVNYIANMSIEPASIVLDLINKTKIYVCMDMHCEGILDQIHIECREEPVEDLKSYSVQLDDDGCEIYSKTLYDRNRM